MKSKTALLLAIIILLSFSFPCVSALGAGSVISDEELTNLILDGYASHVVKLPVLKRYSGDFSSFLESLTYQYPEIFIDYDGFSYSYSGDQIQSVDFSYLFNATDYNRYIELLNAELDVILGGMSGAWNALQKIIYVHDYIALNYSYDESLTIHDVGRFIETRQGVCQAYTALFSIVMKKLDIQCKNVISDSINHTWNIVNAEGRYYHVDVTWDDPVGSPYGTVNHKYLLASDTAFADHGNGDWYIPGLDEYIVCDDSRYEETLSKVASNIVVTDNGFVLFGNEKHKGMAFNLYEYPADITSSPKLIELPDNIDFTWFCTETTYYTDIYTCIYPYKNGFLFSGPHDIFYTEKSGESSTCTVVFTDEHRSEGSIYGFVPFIRDGVQYIRYYLAKTPVLGEGYEVSLEVLAPAYENIRDYIMDSGLFETLKERLKFIDEASYIMAKLGMMCSEVFPTELTAIKCSGSGIAKTGDTAILVDNNDVEIDSISIVVPGDVNGDGKITTQDYISTRLHILGIKPLENAFYFASDVDNSGSINARDYIAIRRQLLAA